ncbi:Lrp/AsnC family leucine-responsive transcriptional regulator [Actinoplanes lutulentus]|uniref:Lrp/AsnC family leucine-responsive transcriptional regulator n=1 Tax=Actinoplanes lutulentus TaxID=1287878 RepID=A0A327ZDG0_9ACTN|nr:Lrp/AsnC family transcriptional regulator [Actinoplanes lutulentus]MBB2948548.1 Lrp/AsnC family leucine-responsive transcriptional regulator [Actinoplanes lutulentus]RAK34420.1 Lrp/AsnC family leucine-responsive transcriptional regulator [Actinoplanes lutulentus]
MADLDDKDCVILDLLQQQGDLPNTDLARQVGLSPAATLRRVQRLRADGVITGVRALVDPEKTGHRIEAFVLVALAEHAEVADTRFAEALAGIPAVLRADAVTGPDDILLHVVAADTRELQAVLRTLPRIGARRVTTLLRLEGLKPPAPIPVKPS